MKKVLGWLHSLPDWVRAGYRTGYQTFLATFGISLLGWFTDVMQWAGNTSGEFPAVSPLGKALVGGLAAVGAGVLSALMNRFGKKSASYPPSG